MNIDIINTFDVNPHNIYHSIIRKLIKTDVFHG